MPEFLAHVASPWWAYLALLGLLVVDVFIPIVPTQVLMITGGALTAYGSLSLPLTIAAGTVGVLCGDLACYLLGQAGRRREAARIAAARDAGAAQGPGAAQGSGAGRLRRFASRFTRIRRAADRLTRGLRRPGPLMILLCRFVPGGRMAVCFHAGRVSYPYRRFLLYEVTAALGWAAYGGVVGHLGGTALTGSTWRVGVIAGVAAVAFAAAGWALTLAGGRRAATTAHPAITPARAASTGEPPR